MDVMGARWRKASRSTVENDNCVEVAGFSDAVAFRDSKDPDGPKLAVSRHEFRQLAQALKAL
ncbi:DUF397 domain-containing protein [Actinomadura sp. GTD37]|uniref:DUF397 domain-containing protein n=1 Tax=Actinomadura sp. GTD37 TaxID=1778030 RepID=UPI0035C1EEFF